MEYEYIPCIWCARYSVLPIDSAIPLRICWKEKLQCEMLQIVHEEMETVQTLIDLRLQDSRIGFESSNHYFYTLQDLKEKMISLAYCEEQLSR